MKIDLVIPWVDGNDPEWLKDKEFYTQTCEGDKRVNRYRDWDNLQYVFRGIEKNMPWINKVHFITYGHLPSWLNTKHPKLNIVRHSDYMDSKYLPTFSANPIEMNIHRIEGLSEYFIYSNDDMFFVEPLSERDFFRDGLPCDCPIERVHCFKKGGIDHIIGNDLELLNEHFSKKETLKRYWKKWFSLRYGRYVLKNLYFLPVKPFPGFVNDHIPCPFLKSTFEEIWEKEPDVLDKTSMNKVRNSGDVNQWLARYWQFASGKFYPGKKGLGKFYSIGRDNELIANALASKKYKMLCLSDDTPELDFEKEKDYIIGLLQKKFPDRSSFEL